MPVRRSAVQLYALRCAARTSGCTPPARSLSRLSHEPDPSVTELAGDFRAAVLLRRSQFLRTVRAHGIERMPPHSGRFNLKLKLPIAEIAGHVLPQIPRVDPQFLLAMRARNEVPHDRRVNHGFNLRQRDKLRRHN